MGKPKFDWDRRFDNVHGLQNVIDVTLRAVRDLHERVSTLEVREQNLLNGLPGSGIPLSGGVPLKHDDKIYPIVLIDRSTWPYTAWVGDKKYVLREVGSQEGEDADLQARVDEFVKYTDQVEYQGSISNYRSGFEDFRKLVYDKLCELGLVKEA